MESTQDPSLDLFSDTQSSNVSDANATFDIENANTTVILVTIYHPVEGNWVLVQDTVNCLMLLQCLSEFDFDFTATFQSKKKTNTDCLVFGEEYLLKTHVILITTQCTLPTTHINYY